MTVSSAERRNEYVGSGSQTVFAYTYRIFSASDLVVYVNAVLQQLTTHYSVSNVDVSGGGNVTFVTAPPSSQSVVIFSDTVEDQTMDLIPQGPMPAETLERTLDKLTVIVQEHEEILRRTLTFKQFSLLKDKTLDDLVAGRVAGVKSDLSGIEWLNKNDLNGLLSEENILDGFTLANLLLEPNTAGRLARVTDSIRGPHIDTGSRWRSEFGVANVLDFVTGGSGTSASPWTGWETNVNGLSTNLGIYFPFGYYRVSTTFLIKSGWRVFGDGPGASILIFPSGIAANTKMLQNSDQAAGNSRVLIADLTLDGNRAANSATAGLTGVSFSFVSSSTIRNIRATGFTQHGIDFTGTSGGSGGPNVDNLIFGNEIDDYGTGSVGFGIDFVGGGDRNRILGNRVTSTLTNVGIAIDDQSGAQASDPGLRNVIANNIVSGMDQGILIEGSHENEISGNIVLSTVTFGIGFAQGATPVAPRDNLVTHNIVIPTSGTGIQNIGHDNLVKGNHINGGATGIAVDDISPGIGPNSRLMILDNKIQGQTGVGIRWTAGIGGKIEGNYIDGPGTHGIHVNTSNRSVEQVGVKRNTVKNAGQHGIFIESGATNAMSDVWVNDNDVVNASVSPSNTYDGINITKGAAAQNRITVYHNTVIDDQGASNTTRYGINVSSTPGSVRVGKNFINNMKTATTNGLTGTGYPAVASITVGASPFTHTNTDDSPQEVTVTGGTVSAIAIIRNTVETALGLTSGIFLVEPGDGLKVTYTGVPTMLKIAH